MFLTVFSSFHDTPAEEHSLLTLEFLLEVDDPVFDAASDIRASDF